MKLRILGGDGGVAKGYQTTSFLINDNILIDAGSAATALSIRDQRKIDYVFISHSHLDHVKDLCFLTDNVFAHRKRPIEIISSAAVIKILREHLFNNKIWPDFSVISNGVCPIIKYREVESNLSIDGIDFQLVPVNHPVPALGFLITDGKKSIVISGDTGPTDLLWGQARRLSGIKAVFTEIAFPNRQRKVAIAAGHFSPDMFLEELHKIPPKTPIWIYHLKPDYAAELKREIKAMRIKPLKLLKKNQRFHF
jgi:ribonuclease BN (tRNA processing enzyme)